VLTSPGRTFFSAVEMSEQAPFVDAATANDPVPFPNTFISYYTYGQALAFGLDLMIRERFPGKSLDDWMRAIWRKHPDDSKPYDLAGLEKTLAETTGDAAFASDFFRRHVYGKEALPFADLLKAAGMRLQLTQPEKLWLGISKADYIDNAVVLTGPTLKGSPLYEAGLDRGDKVLDADGKTFASEKELNAWLAAHKSGDRVKFSVERRTGKQRIDIVLGRAPSLQIKTFEDLGERVEPSALAFRNAWLGSKALRPLPKLTRHCSSCLRTFAAEFEFCPYDGKELKITADRPTVQ
jgi:predicted metalloprotease with PDZ domain